MNKKLLMFLSLFCLVLMLSIYYVSLENETQVISVNSDVEVAKVLSTKELQNKINDNLKQELKIHNEKLASSTTSEENKKASLLAVERIEKVITKQNEIVSKLKEAGYDVTIEIQDTLIHICLFNQKEDQKLAKEVMDLVYQLVNGDYYLELSFK